MSQSFMPSLKKMTQWGLLQRTRREHELERPSEMPDSEPLIQEEKDHELESQDEEEVMPSSKMMCI